jgi:hypothetical protein
MMGRRTLEVVKTEILLHFDIALTCKLIIIACVVRVLIMM